jgi:hypothetical protein
MIIIVKVGGSVAEFAGKLFEDLKSLSDSDNSMRILVIPGGWIFAEKVRELWKRGIIDDEAAHWMAVECMDVYGYYLSRFAASSEPLIPESFHELSKELKPGVRVLIPGKLVRSHDELPHSWDVTSDSIAIWIAHNIGAETIIKATDVDGLIINGEIVSKISASQLRNETCIDTHASKLLSEYKLDLFVCRWDRVKDYILRGEAIGTLIAGSEVL